MSFLDFLSDADRVQRRAERFIRNTNRAVDAVENWDERRAVLNNNADRRVVGSDTALSNAELANLRAREKQFVEEYRRENDGRLPPGYDERGRFVGNNPNGRGGLSSGEFQRNGGSQRGQAMSDAEAFMDTVADAMRETDPAKKRDLIGRAVELARDSNQLGVERWNSATETREKSYQIPQTIRGVQQPGDIGEPVVSRSSPVATPEQLVEDVSKQLAPRIGYKSIQLGVNPAAAGQGQSERPMTANPDGSIATPGQGAFRPSSAPANEPSTLRQNTNYTPDAPAAAPPAGFTTVSQTTSTSAQGVATTTSVYEQSGDGKDDAKSQKELNQKAQAMMERLGLTTGGKNSAAFKANGGEDKMDGLVGPKTKAALAELGIDPAKPITAETLEVIAKAAEARKSKEQVTQGQPAPQRDPAPTQTSTDAPTQGAPAAALTSNVPAQQFVAEGAAQTAFLQAMAASTGQTNKKDAEIIAGLESAQGPGFVKDGKLSDKELASLAQPILANNDPKYAGLRQATEALVKQEGIQLAAATAPSSSTTVEHAAPRGLPKPADMFNVAFQSLATPSAPAESQAATAGRGADVIEVSAPLATPAVSQQNQARAGVGV
jgi:hypothetical protein